MKIMIDDDDDDDDDDQPMVGPSCGVERAQRPVANFPTRPLQ